MILPALHMCDYKTLVKVLVWEVYGAKSIKQGEKTLSRCHFSILKQRIMCSLHSSHLWNADVQFCIYCVKNDLPITLTLLIWESTNFNQLSLPLIPSDVLKQEHSSGFYNRDSADHRIKITTYFKFAMPFFFFSWVVHKAEETCGLTQTNMYVTTKSPSRPTSCLLDRHPFLFEVLRSTCGVNSTALVHTVPSWVEFLGQRYLVWPKSCL